MSMFVIINELKVHCVMRFLPLLVTRTKPCVTKTCSYIKLFSFAQ